MQLVNEDYRVPEDPFSADAPAQIVLRLLVGVQRGAEMPLRAASYAIGRGGDCDIVLADDSVQAAHAHLTVADGAVTLEAREGAVFFHDRVLKPGEQAELELPVALSLGLVAIGLGAPGTDWAGLAITESHPIDDEDDEDETAEDGSDEDAASPDGTTDDDAHDDGDSPGNGGPPDVDPSTQPDAGDEAGEANHADEADVPAAPQPAAATVAARLPDFDRRHLVLVGGGCAVLMVAAFVVVGLLSGHAPEQPPEPQADAAARSAQASLASAEAIADRLGLDEIRFDPAGDGGLTVSGYLPTADERHLLHTALSDAGLTFTDRAHDVQRMLERVHQTLAAQSWPQPNFEEHLLVTYKGAGAIQIDGFLGPEVDRGALSRSLRTDVAGIGTLRLTRSDVRNWKAVLDQRIKDGGLALWLKTAVQGDRIWIGGQLSAKQAQQWRALGQAFVKESRGWPKLVIEVTVDRQAPVTDPTPSPDPVQAVSPSDDDPPQSVNRPNVTVIGVLLSDGRPDRVLLDTGETLATGDRLDSGGVVTGIELDRVTISKGGRAFVYRVRNVQ